MEKTTKRNGKTRVNSKTVSKEKVICTLRKEMEK